jgi:hypothetical protein
VETLEDRLAIPSALRPGRPQAGGFTSYAIAFGLGLADCSPFSRMFPTVIGWTKPGVVAGEAS